MSLVLAGGLVGGLATILPVISSASASMLEVDGGALHHWVGDGPGPTEPGHPDVSDCGPADGYAGTLYAEAGEPLVAPADPAGKGRGWILVGTSGDDVLTGGNHGDCLVGGDGNDALTGGNGPDIAVGGDGNDVLLGGTNRDLLLGNAGDDQLDGGNGPDWMDAGGGNDKCVSKGAPDILEGCETVTGIQDNKWDNGMGTQPSPSETEAEGPEQQQPVDPPASDQDPPTQDPPAQQDPVQDQGSGEPPAEGTPAQEAPPSARFPWN